jgi:hypothetical protein
MKTVVWDVPAAVLPVVCSVTASGDYRRPAATRSSASATTPARNNRMPGDPGFAPPMGVTVSLEILFGKYTEKIYPDPP